MSSSISSSEPARALAAVLPLLPAPRSAVRRSSTRSSYWSIRSTSCRCRRRPTRAPVATNARFSFPALARSAKFDSAVFGTSTSRLLRPVMLDPEFGARFANLAMNDATAYEQARILRRVRAAHPPAHGGDDRSGYRAGA